MSVIKWLGSAALLGILSQDTAAQTQVQMTEVAVNGPQGALLYMDSKAVGRLPLPANLLVSAGPHRFRLELGKQKAESDTLTFPENENGQTELNLTLSGRELIAALRITDRLLLVLQPDSLPAAHRESITTAVAKAAKQEHSVLLGRDKQTALLRQQPSLIRCIENKDCHEPLFQDGQVSYVVSLHSDNDAPEAATSCVLRAALFDVRTRDVSARAEATCAPCDPATLAAQSHSLTVKLLQATATRPRGSASVTSSPKGAKVLVDDRWLGMTPFQQEVFAGSRILEIQRDRYLSQKQTLQVEPNQTSTVQVQLQRDPAAVLARPLWRIVTGSTLIGGGILMAGFGAAALSVNGECQDGFNNIDTCSPYYSTSSIGGGLVGGGAALAIAGTIMLAIPPSSK